MTIKYRLVASPQALIMRAQVLFVNKGMTGRKDGHFFGSKKNLCFKASLKRNEMAKRFTDTDKFIDPWYRRLSTPNKLLWDWILCNCDFAGIICIDLEFVEMVLNEKFEDGVLETVFHDRLEELSTGKYFIPKFIRFQYGKLNKDSRVHKAVIGKLEELGINFDTLSIPYPKGVYTLKEKEKEKEKEKDKEKDKDSSFLKEEECVKNEAPKIDNVIQLFNDKLSGKGRITHCRGLSGKNIHDYITTTSFKEFQIIDTWQEVFQKTGESAFLTGTQIGSNFVATLNWLVVHDNALKVLNGQYGNGPIKNVTSNVLTTPDNPTGNPYYAELKQKYGNDKVGGA